MIGDDLKDTSHCVYLEWKRPEGKADGYMYGDVVTYKGTEYVSVCNCNRYEPGHCGWELLN